MIRLNDINKTVIDESKVDAYYVYEEEKDYCVCIALNGNKYVDYNSKEARDKDIELLDKLFDVKDIEYKAICVAKPNGYINNMTQEDVNGLVSEGEDDLVNKEEYLTWKKVKQYATEITAKLPNGETRMIYYDDDNERIQFAGLYGDSYDGCIYDEDLFNALMLKKVE